MTVKATREGLVGGRTSSGFIIDEVVPFVALPAVKALHRFIKVTNPANSKSSYAIVLDVGPWNENDEAYVFGGQRPASEAGKSVSGRGTNGAGIDLSQRLWKDLGMLDNANVEWEFI